MLMSGQHTASGGIFSDGAVSEPPGKSWQWLIMNLDKFDHDLTSRSQWNVGLFGIILKWPHLRLVNDYDSPGNECPSLNCHQLVVKSQHVWAHPVGQAGVRIIFQIFLMVGDLNITLVGGWTIQVLNQFRWCYCSRDCKESWVTWIRWAREIAKLDRTNEFNDPPWIFK